MATIKALKDLHSNTSTIKVGSVAEMDDKKAEFHVKRGNVEIIKTKELKLETSDK